MGTREYYDAYVERQLAVGVNARHRGIIARLLTAGLRPEHRVLELGCGVGTLTGLLAKALQPHGKLVAIDMSPRSIDVARERLKGFDRLELFAGDALEIEIAGRFDVVVLPDVVEHIPLESHRALFARVREWLEPHGFALLNYPNPHYLEWCHIHDPGALQEVDQAIHADVLLANCYPAGLYLDSLEVYSLWVKEGDYVAVTLRPTAGIGAFTSLPERPPSLLARGVQRLRAKPR